MANINEILARAAALRDETALNSISPERAGGIMYDTLLALNELWLQQGSALVISKIYASVAAMEADSAPVSDLTGQPLRPGQIVVIASSDSDNGSVYRYNGIVNDASSWTLVGAIGNLDPVDSLDSDSTTLPLAAHQGKVLDGKINQLGQKVGERDCDVPLDLGQSSAGYYTGSTGQTIGSTTSNGYKYAGIDISAYVGYQISIGILNPSSATSRRTAICDADDKILTYWGEGDFRNGNPKLYEVKPGDKRLYCSAQLATSTFSVYVKEYPTGIFSDISKINKELGLKADASKLYDVERVAGYPVSLSFGGKYNTYGAKGAVASMAYSADSNWANYNELANKGDIFYIYGNGGVSPKLWAFLEIGTNVIIDAADENAIGVDTMIVAPSDCRVVININMLGASTYRVMKVINKVGAIINRDELTRLNALYDEPLVKVPYFMGFAGIIHHWGFVGDSLMSGYMEREETSFSQYEYSWGQRMCAMLGVEGYNFSQGGQTAKGWINGAGIPERSWAGAKTNLKQGYIIGMGANDRSESYPLGDVTTDIGTYDPVTDTDTNADSFAGYYAGMIQRIQSVQPTAKIFVVTLPYQPTRDVNPYNDVIRAMCSIFSNVYLIDMYAYARNYYLDPGWSNLFDTNHLNVIGYEYTAYVMMTYIDWIIRNNYSAFKKVNEIPV